MTLRLSRQAYIKFILSLSFLEFLLFLLFVINAACLFHSTHYYRYFDEFNDCNGHRSQTGRNLHPSHCHNPGRVFLFFPIHKRFNYNFAATQCRLFNVPHANMEERRHSVFQGKEALPARGWVRMDL